MSRLAAARGLLTRAVADGVTPGAQLCVVWPDGLVEETVVGAVSRAPDAPAVTPSTVYDLASLTKPLTAMAWVHSGLDLTRPLSAYLPAAEGTSAGEASILSLLTHRAGLVHWAPFYRQVVPADAGTATARATMVSAILATPRGEPGAARYSDLGYILAGEALACALGAPLDSILDRTVLHPLGLRGALAFRGVGTVWQDDPTVAPTELCAWRGRVVHGEVHDENAWTLGGIAGHAGLFGTASAMATLGQAALDALAGRSHWLSREAMACMVAPREGGSYRLGWDGRSAQGSSAGGSMGSKTFGHLGFTGTSVWCDPDAGVVVALVTNRVHPTREATGIRALRPAVHDAVMAAYRA